MVYRVIIGINPFIAGWCAIKIRMKSLLRETDAGIYVFICIGMISLGSKWTVWLSSVRRIF